MQLSSLPFDGDREPLSVPGALSRSKDQSLEAQRCRNSHFPIFKIKENKSDDFGKHPHSSVASHLFHLQKGKYQFCKICWLPLVKLQILICEYTILTTPSLRQRMMGAGRKHARHYPLRKDKVLFWKDLADVRFIVRPSQPPQHRWAHTRLNL